MLPARLWGAHTPLVASPRQPDEPSRAGSRCGPAPGSNLHRLLQAELSGPLQQQPGLTFPLNKGQGTIISLFTESSPRLG